VGYIGDGASTVTFPQVDVGTSGAHTLVVHGVSADPRSLVVTVNAGSPITVDVQSASWTAPTTVSVSVSLEQGINTIAFGNPSAYAPDLDRIVVW
jgi:alpha-galactosidase